MSYSKRFNPFKPNSPVNPGMFAGRLNEIDRIEDAFVQMKNGNPTNLLFLGERGIGKSSLLLFANFLAKGKLKDDLKYDYNFLTIQFNLSESLTLIDLIKKINSSIRRELSHQDKALEYLKKTWDFLQKLEIAGSKVSTQRLSEQEVFGNFVYSLSDTVNGLINGNFLAEKGLKTKKDGLVLLIDEVDNASDELELGTFLKNLTEALLVENCHNISFILTGLPKSRDILLSSHQSSLRLFEEIVLNPLSDKDIERIYSIGLNRVNEQVPSDKDKIIIDNNAIQAMINLSEGYPHFAQQIGSSVFNINKDQIIDPEDVHSGFMNTGGALDLIGKRYYHDMFYNKIKRDSYRQILKIMSESESIWVTRKEIREKFKGKDETLGNGLKALRDRNIIISRIGRRGEYKLQWVGFRLWIKYLAERIEKGNI